MIKRTFYILLIFIIGSIVYLNLIGINTSKFNNKIQAEVRDKYPQINLELNDIKILLNISKLSIDLETDYPIILLEKEKIKLKKFSTTYDLKSFLKREFAITNLFIDSTYENNLNICRQVTVELEVFAGVKVPKVDEKLREVASVKLLQEKFNAKSSPKEFYLNNLKIFISNLSGKKPTTKEIKMWHRIIDLHDYFLS